MKITGDSERDTKHTILLIGFFISGCANYEFGDATRTALKAREIYCSPAVSDAMRQNAKARLEAMGINTGQESVCALTIEKLLGSE